MSPIDYAIKKSWLRLDGKRTTNGRNSEMKIANPDQWTRWGAVAIRGTWAMTNSGWNNVGGCEQRNVVQHVDCISAVGKMEKFQVSECNTRDGA